jgi:hypothetical protein
VSQHTNELEAAAAWIAHLILFFENKKDLLTVDYLKDLLAMCKIIGERSEIRARSYGIFWEGQPHTV